MRHAAINPAPFVKTAGELPPLDAGQKPSLRWLRIADLVIDSDYQRVIGRTGSKNIVRIAREFQWARFSPVIVAPVPRNRFAIIDGQHRTTAAALRGLMEVPCQVMEADEARQAAAFAAINANVTEMSPMQIHAAQVAARDPDALRLKKICAAGGVTICRYPVPASKMVKGQTLAVSQLRKALERYGERPLRLSLTAITSTRDGNVGMVRGQLVMALCAALEPCGAWMAHPGLLGAFQKFDFKAAWIKAAKDSVLSHGRMVSVLTEAIRTHLAAEIGGPA